VLAQGGGGIVDLAVDHQVHEVLELVVVEPAIDEAELERRLLAALGEVEVVEREAQLPVFEHEVLPGVVVASTLGVHGPSASYGRLLPRARPCTRTCTGPSG
jgi:hypothetical protein